MTVSNLYPQVGTRITPTLTDPDTPISNLIWTWEVGGNVESRANAYTPKGCRHKQVSSGERHLHRRNGRKADIVR